jgi:hypothetical protein
MTLPTTPKKLPPAVLRTLQALWDADRKCMHREDARKASGVKTRAFHPWWSRLLDRNFVDYVGPNASVVTLTFAGMLALRAHYQALYNERPCEAHRLSLEAIKLDQE